MKRPRLHLILASLILLASGAEWIHSQFRANALAYARPTLHSTQIIAAASECGEIIFYSSTQPPNFFTGFKTTSADSEKQKFADNTTPLQKLGFAFHANAAGDWACEFPWWTLSLAAALSLLHTSFRKRRAILKNRLAYGACAKCGHDLRGSPTCCPECGTPIAGRHFGPAPI